MGQRANDARLSEEVVASLEGRFAALRDEVHMLRTELFAHNCCEENQEARLTDCEERLDALAGRNGGATSALATMIEELRKRVDAMEGRLS